MIYTCCFTGHRPENLFNNECDTESSINERIVSAVESAICDGYNRFLCGGCRGADFMFAEAVISLKSKYPDIKLEFVLPCRNQSENWNRDDRDRYSSLLDAADSVICLNDTYTKDCMLERDRYLVDHSTLLIAAFNGTKGGTEYTFKYAKRKHIRILNVLTVPVQETAQMSFL